MPKINELTIILFFEILVKNTLPKKNKYNVKITPKLKSALNDKEE